MLILLYMLTIPTNLIKVGEYIKLKMFLYLIVSLIVLGKPYSNYDLTLCQLIIMYYCFKCENYVTI